MSWHDSSGYLVVDLLLCAGNFIFARQPTADNSAGLRTEEILIGSLLSVMSACPGNSLESFSGTAVGLVGIREFRLDRPVLFTWLLL
jgi:hypothetical protein